MAQTGRSRPDSGLGFQVKVLITVEGVPSSLGSGLEEWLYRTDTVTLQNTITLYDQTVPSSYRGAMMSTGGGASRWTDAKVVRLKALLSRSTLSAYSKQDRAWVECLG